MRESNQVSPRVIVTGASGFIGSGLVSTLGPGRSSILSVRDDGWPARLGKIRFEGTTLVHLGGRAHLAGTDATGIDNDNCARTLSLARLTQSRGLKRFVFVSSVKVHGDSSLRPFTETDPLLPEDAYARAKRDAETGLARIAQATGLEVVVLRPPVVYGPGVRGNFLSLLELASSPWPLPFASLGNRRSLVSRANLVSVIETCIAHPQAPGLTFLVSDGAPVSMAQLVTTMRAAMGRSPGMFRFPAAGLRALATLAGRRDAVSKVIDSLEVDASRLRSILGWQPVQGFEEAIGETVRWFGSSGAPRE